MPEINVLVLLGSLRAASVNRQLVDLAVESAPEGVTLRLFDRLGELPLYNEDIDNDQAPEPVVALRQVAAAADAAFVVTPEYNGSTRSAQERHRLAVAPLRQQRLER